MKGTGLLLWLEVQCPQKAVGLVGPSGQSATGRKGTQVLYLQLSRSNVPTTRRNG